MRSTKFYRTVSPMAQPKRSYLSYHEAVEYIRKRNLKSRDDYWRWWSSLTPHPPVPKMPHRVYPEWESWNVYLGTTNVFDPKRGTKRKINYRPFWEAVRMAQSYAKQYKITTQKGWEEWCDSGMCPKDIPKYPPQVYPEFVGTGWTVWLGKNIESKVETAKREVSVLALAQVAGQPANVITLVVEPMGLSALKEKWDASVMGKLYRVYKFEKEMVARVDHLMGRFAHKRDDKVYLVPNMQALISELDFLLEMIRI